MNRLCTAFVAGTVATAWTAAAAAAGSVIPGYITAAVANTDRPAADRARDALRKPAEVIAFAGLKPGDRIGELMPGRGYFTQIFCRVVGSGHVYAVSITPAMSMRGPPPGGGRAAGSGPPPAPKLACDNVTESSEAAAQFKLPGSLDMVWTSENYHDLHNAMFGKPDMAAFDKVIYDALKPGGVFIVEDHAAAAGSGARDTGTLHRIDPALVKQEVEGVGFRLVGSSDLLRNPGDPHTAKVFDLNGRSDKFLLKFQKSR